MSVQPFELAIADVGGALRVHSLRGKEAMSRAWQFDVIASGPSGDELERLALGQQATLVVQIGDRCRALYGVVAAVEVEEAHRIERETKYLFRLVPRLWLLKQRRRTRIFQGMRVPDIVASVLREVGIATRWALVRAYPAREYCTQYEESDYEFVRRILAEAGIFFYFFGGGPMKSGALTVNALASAAAGVASALGAPDAASAAAALMAETLVPGDTFVGADDSAAYPGIGADDAAALAASTAAFLAASIAGEVSDLAGAAAGLGSAVASSVIAAAEGSALTLHCMANDGSAVATYDKVVDFTLRNRVRPKRGTFRDYDPAKPNVMLQSASVSTAPFPASALELAAAGSAAAENMVATITMVAGAASPAISAGISTATGAVTAAEGLIVPSEVYEHHSSFLFPKWSVASNEAPLILRQARRRASTARGEGACHDLSPGHRFQLRDHMVPQIDGGYVATEVVHHGHTKHEAGRASRVYFNTFECAPESMAYVPKRPPRRSIQVALTARVVGAGGDDIHVDSMGRIKVQFHWHREGTLDSRSSCWIRTLQAWAGASYGHQFIPRVGMEVIVVFEGGDPDKPMVLGSLYNATHPPSFALPAEKTRSGIRTQTSPQGGGYNELSFEDAKGREEIFVRAQKDLREDVMENRVTTVGRTQSTVIGADLQEQVKGDRHSHVKGAHYASRHRRCHRQGKDSKARPSADGCRVQADRQQAVRAHGSGGEVRGNHRG